MTGKEERKAPRGNTEIGEEQLINIDVIQGWQNER